MKMETSDRASEYVTSFFLNYSLKIAQLKMPIFLMFLKSEPKGERISGTMSKLEERLRFQNHAVHVTASFYSK